MAASQDQLQTALINADKAGDTAAATVLAGELKKMRTPQSPSDKATSELGLNPISKDNLAKDLSEGIDKVKNFGGDVAASISKPTGMPQTITQDAQREAKSRSVGEAVPDLLATLIPVGGEEKAEEVVSDTVKAAKEYVSKHTSLSWDSLTQEFKDRLSAVAKDAKGFDKLDPKAVERQGKLNSLPKPITTATKGQLSRDTRQTRIEQLVKNTSSGDALRQMDIDSNKSLLDNLDILKKETGGKTTGALQTGRSVQGPLRADYAREKQNVSKLYKIAEESGETQSPVDINPLKEWVSNPIHNRRAPFVKQFITDMVGKERPHAGIEMTVNELEELRKEAVSVAQGSDKTAGYWAGQVIDKIDSITEGAGGKAYQAARSARKQLGEEYERTESIANLVQNKRMSNSRATALEATWQKTVKTGTYEGLQAVKDSLGKTPEGIQAWNDLRGQTIEYIKSKATHGESGIKNQAGDLEAAWSGIKRAVDDIGQDKLTMMFGEKVTKQINDIVESAQILKTDAPDGTKGSPTIDKLMVLLDKVPIVGWTVGVAKKLGEIGKAGRVTRAAKVSPVEEAAKGPSTLLKNIKRSAPAGAVLLSEQNKDSPP